MSEETSGPAVQVGDTVKYPAGRGLGEGRVVQITGDFATVRTRNGGLVNRLLSRLKKVDPTSEAKAAA